MTLTTYLITFLSEYSKHFETCFPFKTIKGNNFNKIRTPWISKGLLVSTRKKNRLYKKFINNPNQARNDLHKTYKNKLNHLIRIARRNYYDERLRNAKNNIKVSWKLIHEVLNNKKTKHTLPSTFKVDGKKSTDKLEIADKFCKYFTNIGQNLANKKLLTNFSFYTSLGTSMNETIWLKPTNIAVLEQVCMSFKKSKASGFDNIPTFIIQNSFAYISEALVHIIYLPFIKGIFQDKLKIAKLIPIHKTDDPELFFNYRPMSLLSNFSKFFERIMYKRLIDFVERFDILHCNQFGFRENHSTRLALVHLINKIASSIDRNEITAGVVLDFSKAFDTLNHEIIFCKLEHYGIRGLALQWIKGYFSNPKQFVQYNNTSSSLQTIKCGLP